MLRKITLAAVLALAACATEPTPTPTTQLPPTAPPTSALCQVHLHAVVAAIGQQGGRPVRVPDDAGFMRRYNAFPPPTQYRGRPLLFKLDDTYIVLIELDGCVESSMKIRDRGVLTDLLGGTSAQL
jgi:hypothetical protein